MFKPNRCAKVNVKVLVILILVTVAIASSLFAAREVRRNLLSKMNLDAGQAAFEKGDWAAASKHLRGYLARNPDDVEVLKKYAKAQLSVQPLDAAAVGGAIAAYRRIIQLAPLDEVAYEKLAQLYTGIGNFEELAYIARIRLDQVPGDRKAPLWLAEALNHLRKTDAARETLDKFIKELEPLADKPAEYVQACVLMSQIAGSPGSIGAATNALEWLSRAAVACPESVEALVLRARFYRERADIPDLSEDERLALARKDLQAADALGTDDPRVRLFLGAEWLEHGDLDQAAAELQIVENIPPEGLEGHFFDLHDWTVARFLFASQLAIKRKAIAEGVLLTNKVLTDLTEQRHRVRVLPSAVMLYVAAGKVPEARKCLDEYLGLMHTQEVPAESKLGLAYLQALVARTEDKPYVVIDVLQPAVVMDASRPELWRLLADAFSRTDQSRRAVSALVKYLRLRPRDPEVTMQLAKEYLRLRDWNRAYETARLAEPMDPADIVIRLLRIESSIYRTAELSYQIQPSSLEPLSVELAQLRQDHPDRVDIRILQAIIADYLEKSDEAEKELKLAIEQCPDPLRAEMQLVRHYQRNKRMMEAVSACRAACERHPEIAEPWLSLSGLHVAQADYDSAHSTLTQGLRSVIGRWEQRSLSIQLGLVELYYGNRAEGIVLLSKVAKEDPQEIRARALLLNVREIQQNQRIAKDQPTYEELIKQLRTAEGESGLYWRLYQAALWLAADDWRSKQPDITAAAQYCIDSDPEWSAPALLLANMYEKLEDFKRKEDTCRQALVRNPSATDVADVLITLLEKQGRFSDAEKVLTQIETNPRVTSAWYVRMALNSQDYSRAIEELKLRVSNDDRDANSRILLARLLYWQTGDAKQAFDLLSAAEAITPDSITLAAAKVAILRATGQTEKAQQILDDYVAHSKAFGAYTMRAAYLANTGQLERAEQDYRKLTSFTEQGTAGYELLSNFYARTQRLDQAVAALDEGLDAYPEDLKLKRRLMKTLFVRNQAQDQQRALKILAELQDKLPQDPELMKIEAMHLLQAKTPDSLETAGQKLQNVVKLEPTAVDAHLMLIGIEMQQGHYEDARDSAIRALGSNPENPSLLSARAGAELLLENIPMAAQLVNLALQKDPNNTHARDVLVDAAIKSKDRSLLEQARTLTESALDSDPTSEQLLLSWTRVLVSMEQAQVAIPKLEVYCRTEKGSLSVPAIVTLADLYRLNGDMDRSKQRIEQARQINPDSLAVIHAQFLWLVAQKRFGELSQISSAYLSAKEQNPTTLMAAASILAPLDSMELKKGALKLFEQAVILAPTSKAARLGLASTLYQTGDADRAVTIYQKLYAEYPNDLQTLNDLAWILQEHNRRYDAALELANRGLVLAPDEIHLLDTRGTILANMENRLGDARKDFEKLVKLAPPDSRQKAGALLKLGRTCAKLKDPVQAKQHLQDALEIDRKIDVFTADERSEIARILQTGGM